MSIPNYARPQLTIKQLLDRTATATANRINAIAVGPQYLLSRYGNETLPETVFSSADAEIPYEYDLAGVDTALTDQVVDLDSVEVYAKNLEAVLANTLTNDVTVPVISQPNIIKSAAAFAGTSLDNSLRGRDTQIGDVVYVTDNAVPRRRKVIGLLGAEVASKFGTNVDKDDALFAASTANATASTAAFVSVTAPAGTSMATASAAAFNIKENYNRGPRLAGQFGDRFTLTVLEGGAPLTSKIKITSASGLYYLPTLTSTSGGATVHTFTHAELGGLTVNITAATGLVSGQVFVFTILGTHAVLDLSGEGSAYIIPGGIAYTGTKDTTYIVRVVTTNTTLDTAIGTVLHISDTAGVEEPQLITIAANSIPQAMGTKGLEVAISMAAGAQDFLLTGETYYVHAVAATKSTTSYDRLVLDGPAIDPSIHTNPATAVTSVKVVLPFTGEIENDDSADSSAWTADADAVSVQSGLSLYVAERDTSYQWVAFDNAKGTISVAFRALVPPAYGESIITIDQSSDITAQLGTIALENDLAYAAAMALSGAQGQRIYALRVGSDDATGFNNAFKKVESTDMVYAFAIISTKEEVKLAAKLHMLSMSEPESKKFRRAYVGTDSPGEYTKLQYDTNEDVILATVTSNGTVFTIVTIDPDAAEGVDFSTLGLVAGDKVEIAGGSYPILSVLSASQLELSSGPGAPVSPPQALVIKKADTPESQVAYVAQVSAGIGTRRVANVWVEGGRKIVDGLTTNSGVLRTIPCRFIAAEIAGLRSAVPPQQGLTRTEITSITEAAPMHARYTPSLLDTAAAAGTYVITQDVESGAVFIRHQLTTETDKGSLYYEDSVGVNLDNISFACKDLLEGYIGRYNVNQQTISEIRNRMYQLLNSYTQSDVETTIGPALTRFDNLVVEADPILKDRINISATLFMPLPLNNIETTLQGSVDLTL